MTDHQPDILASWLQARLDDGDAGLPPPPGLDPDVVEAVDALRPDLAPVPTLDPEELFEGLMEGPFADAPSEEERAAAEALAAAVEGELTAEQAAALDDDAFAAMAAMAPDRLPVPAFDEPAIVGAASPMPPSLADDAPLAPPANRRRWVVPAVAAAFMAATVMFVVLPQKGSLMNASSPYEAEPMLAADEGGEASPDAATVSEEAERANDPNRPRSRPRAARSTTGGSSTPRTGSAPPAASPRPPDAARPAADAPLAPRGGAAPAEGLSRLGYVDDTLSEDLDQDRFDDDAAGTTGGLIGGGPGSSVSGPQYAQRGDLASGAARPSGSAAGGVGRNAPAPRQRADAKDVEATGAESIAATRTAEPEAEPPAEFAGRETAQETAESATEEAVDSSTARYAPGGDAISAEPAAAPAAPAAAPAAALAPAPDPEPQGWFGLADGDAASSVEGEPEELEEAEDLQQMPSMRDRREASRRSPAKKRKQADAESRSAAAATPAAPMDERAPADLDALRTAAWGVSRPGVPSGVSESDAARYAEADAARASGDRAAEALALRMLLGSSNPQVIQHAALRLARVQAASGRADLALTTVAYGLDVAGGSTRRRGLLFAQQGELLEIRGDREGAADSYRRAARLQ